MRRLLLACTMLVALSLSGCGGEAENAQTDAATGETSSKEGFDAIEDAEGLSTASKYLKAAGLEQMLDGRGSYTIFAPSDDAFAALPADQREVLEGEEGRPQLLALLRQHMATGYLAPEDIEKAATGAEGVELASLGAAPITLRKDGDTILLGQGPNSPRIAGEPVPAGNSIVYRIDRLLPPPAE